MLFDLFRFPRWVAAISLPMMVCLMGTVAHAQAVPVDLSKWKPEGTHVDLWFVDSTSQTVTRVTNDKIDADWSVFYSNNETSIGNSFTTTIEINTDSDDDFFGFVIGFNPGDLTATAAEPPDYILIDWNGATDGNTDYHCSTSGGGDAGLAISRVRGALFDNPLGAWCHKGAAITELARATNLGSTGWKELLKQRIRRHDFRIDVTSTKIDVYVNGNLELSVTGSFSEGHFGFYNHSQANVIYSGVTRTPITSQMASPSAIPANQTTWMMALGLALFALYAIRRRSKRA